MDAVRISHAVPPAHYLGECARSAREGSGRGRDGRQAIRLLGATLVGILAAAMTHAQDNASPTPSAAAHIPVTLRFKVDRYEVSGSTALDQKSVDAAMAEAIGPQVSVPQIRRALVKLQQAYRDRGLSNIAVRLPRQPLTHGLVRLLAAQGSPPGTPISTAPATPAGQTTVPASNAPTYDVRHFEVRGNSVLPVEEIDRLLGPAAGPQVNLDQLQQALSRLQAAYRARGYARAAVQLPQQLVTDGTLAIVVDEGRSPQELAAKPPTTTVNPEPAPAAATGPTFEVKRFEVAGNTVLPPEAVEHYLANAVGAAVGLPQIQKALGDLQLAYRERGFATVSVSLPQQQITNGVIKVQVTEGALVDAQVLGHRYFSSNNVMRALPSVREALRQPDTLLNSRVFQRELDLANQNRDRQIYPTIGPGPEPGTSALTLRVKDRLPLHGRLDINNQSTPGTPDWRVNASLQYNNLWQREHQAGLSYGFTPEAFKAEGLINDYLLNRPLISYFGGYYRLSFGGAEDVGRQIARSAAFGYDEATRQFRLPPAGARPDLTFFASSSSSDTGVQFGPETVVSQTPLLTIVSQDSGQNLSINESLGARISLPRAIDDNQRWSLSAGLDWKSYLLESFNTNNFIITTVVTNSQGSQTIQSRVSSPQPDRRNQVQYLPLTVAADYSQNDAHGTLSASFGLSGNFVSGDDQFAALAYSTNASATYGKATLALTRDQKVFRNWSLLLRASGQAATGALISNEQYPLGGLNSVRGYYEGDQYGDAGWSTSIELRTPYLNSRLPGASTEWPVWVRGSLFTDYGQGFLLSDSAAGERFALWGAGFGVSANVKNTVDLRIAVGWPLLESINTSVNDPRAYLSLGGQF